MACSARRGALLLPLLLGLAACVPGPAAGPARPAANDRASGGERAIDDSRALGAPDYGTTGNNTGTWGGQQLPNIPAAPRL
jgi:hypothetical protein